MVKVVTINILFDMEAWQQRCGLLVEGLKAEQPDLVGVQEVNLDQNTGPWLAEQLGMPYIYVVPYQGLPYRSGPAYGAAILSRHPFTRQEKLDLQSQGRFAQYVQVEIDNQPLVFCNGHYYWQPGNSPERLLQIRRLLSWLAELPAELPVIAVGDFNATPETPEIQLMGDRFASAYAKQHGQEPDYTCPTPLAKRRSLWRSIGIRLVSWWGNRTFKSWRGTIDYIFLSQQWNVQDCRVILNQPAPGNPAIYPSDHFGIAADLKCLIRE